MHISITFFKKPTVLLNLIYTVFIIYFNGSLIVYLPSNSQQCTGDLDLISGDTKAILEGWQP